MNNKQVEIGAGSVVMVNPSGWHGCLFQPKRPIKCKVLYTNAPAHLSPQFMCMPLDPEDARRFNWKYVFRSDIEKVLPA